MPSRRGSGPPITFEKDAYVMAMWHNRFEYLAKVIGSRQRSREQPEFRLRFVWDRVVDWIPASKIRLATEKEITEVETFIRQVNRDVPFVSRNVEGGASRSPVVSFPAEGRLKRESKRRLSSVIENPGKHTKLNPPDHPSMSLHVKRASVSQKSPERKTSPTSAVKRSPAPTTDPIAPTNQPVTYPCPFCIRCFRHDRLLDVHLRNYHRGNVRQMAPSEAPSSPLEPRISNLVSSPYPKGKTVSPTVYSASPKQVSVPIENDTEVATSLPRFPDVLVYCPSCKVIGPAKEPLQNLIQCSVCRVWTHKTCAASQQACSFVCTACSRHPASLSVIDPFNSWSACNANEDGQTSASMDDVVVIFREVKLLMSWIRQLSVLLNTGRHVMCHFGKSNGPVKPRPSSSARRPGITSTTTTEVKATSSVKESKQYLAMDFPFISDTHDSIPGDDHFNAFLLQLPGIDGFGDDSKMHYTNATATTIAAHAVPSVATASGVGGVGGVTIETADITGILENLVTNNPPDDELTDLITTIPEDFLAVPQISFPGGSSSQATPVQLLDTPTKALLENLDRELGPSTSCSKLFQPLPTTRAPDFGNNFSTASSPLFTTPIKINPENEQHQQNSSDFEAAASLIGLAQSATTGDFGSLRPSGVMVANPQCGAILDGGELKPTGDFLGHIHTNILVPGDEMMTLVENRLKVLTNQVDDLMRSRLSSPPPPRPFSDVSCRQQLSGRRFANRDALSLKPSDRIRTTAVTATSSSNSFSEYYEEEEMEEELEDCRGGGGDSVDEDDDVLWRSQGSNVRYPQPRFAPKGSRPPSYH